MIRRICTAAVTLLILIPAGARAQVVINEIFYNAPEDLDDLEYIELHNAGNETVDLTGWSFTKGIKFKFAAGTRVDPKGFLVLCRSRERFKEFYDSSVAGTFEQKLSNDGERLELSDSTGKVVDAVTYADTAPWPTGADGLSGSLERVTPAADGRNVANWASSPLSESRVIPAGTPGRVNASFSENFPPAISNVTFTEDASAGGPVAIEADVRDSDGVADVALLYRLVSPGLETREANVPMRKVAEGRYAATIPAQEKDQLIRFRIRGTDARGTRRFFPAETEPRPAFSIYVRGKIEPAKIPFAWIINTSESEVTSTRTRRRGGFDADEMARMQSRMILETGIDLQGAWFELTARRAIDSRRLLALKPLFAAKVAERDRLIDDTVESGNIQEKLRRLPEIIRTFQTNLIESLRPRLGSEENKVIAIWLAAQSVGGGGEFREPRAVLKMLLNIEAAWFAVSAVADVDEARLPALRTNFVALINRRNQLTNEVATAMQEPNGFGEIMQRVGAFEDDMLRRIKPLVTPAQEQQLQSWRNSREMFGPRRPSTPSRSVPSHASAFIYFDPAGGRLQVFDFVQVMPRSGGHKVRFYKDRPFEKMTTINLLYEEDRAVLAEPLAYEVYRRAGIAVEQSFHIRIWQNSQPLGFHALVEQPNRAFLRRNRLNDDGNLYKLLWYERGVVGQHEKKTNVREGHDDIVALVGALEQSHGDAEWEIIRKHFDVEQVATYFAVNMVISHWDGFFNNYFTYHDVGGTGKWTMYPWDQDKTWGMYDGARGEVFYDLPITFGMEGDAPPGQARGSRRGGSPFGRGGPEWWRPPGYFSGPLLANPHFRRIFLVRTKEILDRIYTEEAFGPVIDDMEKRLRDEVEFRAEAFKEDPARALSRFERNINNFREHLRLRREFLLNQPEVMAAKR